MYVRQKKTGFTLWKITTARWEVYDRLKKGGKRMEALVKAAKEGDDAAFVRLMEKNKQSMYKTAWVYLKNDADIADAIQDTILSCYENLPQLRQARYFRTWMIRILINKCNDILKKRLSYTDIRSVREEGTKDAGLERSEWKELLNALDEKYSIVLLMHYYEEMTVTEIGRALGVNRNTVLTRLHRGRKLLRNELQPIEKCRSSIFS